jgi:hypothetical protein
MRFTRWNRRHGALAVAVLATAAVAAPGLPAASAAKTPGPALKMAAAQNSIRVPSFRGRVFIDPGIWLEAFGSPLEFDVQRAAYTKPVTITQIIHPPYGGVIRRQLPSSLLDNWAGLAHFATMTLRNSAGTVIQTQSVAFCPNSYNAARARPGSPATSPYPTQCGFNPFTLAQVWGVQRGWGVEPSGFINAKIPLGVYHVTETISPAYAHLFGVSARDATATVKVTVVKGRQCCPVPGCCGAASRHPRHPAGLQQNPSGVPTLNNPPPAALPDLVALPAWGIRVPHPRKPTGTDLLTFGATVWIGGNSPLDVEGFRSHGSPIMKAYQYFWRNGHVIGRVRAGTMGFDSEHGHNHWHFEQFARYTLLNSHKSLVVSSHKVGFCIAPVDGINLLLPHAVWNPPFTGLSGQCGSPSALWVTEELPIGWGDTYEQSLAGQAFDITHVPNGTYYIKVTANPERVLHETTTSNDVSYRKVILGGTPGHRTVKVPAWHGIDPEG